MKFSSNDDFREFCEYSLRYYTDSDYQINIQEKYLNNPFELSIFDIYLLEEEYKFGKYGIFRKMMELNKINEPINSIRELEELYGNSYNELQSLYTKSKKNEKQVRKFKSYLFYFKLIFCF